MTHCGGGGGFGVCGALHVEVDAGSLNVNKVFKIWLSYV